jgi:hypothetical protein
MPSVGYSSLVKNFDPAANTEGTMQMLRWEIGLAGQLSFFCTSQ